MNRPTPDELFRLYRPRVLSFCRRFARSNEDAHDLSCEVFFRIVRGYSGFDGRSHVSTWILAISRNVCFSHISRRRKEAATMQPQICDYTGNPASPFGSSVFDIHKEEDDILGNIVIENAMGILGAQLREIVIKYHIEGLSQAEIANELGVSRPAIGKSLKRVESRWQEMLKGGKGFSVTPISRNRRRKTKIGGVTLKAAA